MTVPAQTPVNSYVYSGSSTFVYAFQVIQAGDLVVTVDGVQKTLAVDYTVAGVGVQAGGSITYLGLLTAGQVVTLRRSTALQRLTDYQTNGDFLSPTVNADFDRIWQALQEGYAVIGQRAIRAPIGEILTDMPPAATRAGYLLGFDSLGQPIIVTGQSGTASSLALDLATSNNAAKGAGQIGFAYALAYGANTIGKWLKDLATSVGSSFIGFIQSGAGAVARLVQDELRERVSVTQFGAVGDGVNDDSAAIQAAENTGKTVHFPKPSNFYKTTVAIAMGNSPHWIGERGITTIIRRTSGAGPVLDFPAGTQNGVLEHLTIGGAGTTGLTVGGGGYVNYLSTLSMRNVHFEGDQLVNINANLIHPNFVDCTFGYFTQTAPNANLQHILTSFSGGLNTNILGFTNCKFFNGATALPAVSIASGLVATFLNCAWENNGRDLAASNVQNCLLLNCYTERGKHATSQFDFGPSRVRAKIMGGQFNGGIMPAGAAMFRSQTGGPLLVEDADISMSATAFAYKNASTGLNSLPTSGEHHFRNCRIQGNVADPLLYLDNIIEDAVNTFVPVPVSLAVVNGSGGATYSGTWSIRNRIVTVTFLITTTGTCTTAATAGATYFPLPLGLPAPQTRSTGGVNNEVSGASLGVGLVYIAPRFFPPTWAPQQGNIAMSMTYPI